MSTYNLIQIILSKTEKRVLVIFCLLFLLIVLFVGLLAKLYKKISIKNSKKIDQYVIDYIKYGFVKNPTEFKQIANQKNQLLLLKQAWFPLLILASSFILFFTYYSINKIDYNYIWKLYDDMLIKFEWTWAQGVIPYPTEWPHINYETSLIFYNDGKAIVGYIFLILFLIGLIGFIIATCKYNSREKRIKEKAKTIFNSSLDNFDSLQTNVIPQNNINN